MARNLHKETKQFVAATTTTKKQVVEDPMININRKINNLKKEIGSSSADVKLNGLAESGFNFKAYMNELEGLKQNIDNAQKSYVGVGPLGSKNANNAFTMPAAPPLQFNKPSGRTKSGVSAGMDVKNVEQDGGTVVDAASLPAGTRVVSGYNPDAIMREMQQTMKEATNPAIAGINSLAVQFQSVMEFSKGIANAAREAPLMRMNVPPMSSVSEFETDIFLADNMQQRANEQGMSEAKLKLHWTSSKEGFNRLRNSVARKNEVKKNNSQFTKETTINENPAESSGSSSSNSSSDSFVQKIRNSVGSAPMDGSAICYDNKNGRVLIGGSLRSLQSDCTDPYVIALVKDEKTGLLVTDTTWSSPFNACAALSEKQSARVTSILHNPVTDDYLVMMHILPVAGSLHYTKIVRLSKNGELVTSEWEDSRIPDCIPRDMIMWGNEYLVVLTQHKDAGAGVYLVSSRTGKDIVEDPIGLGRHMYGECLSVAVDKITGNSSVIIGGSRILNYVTRASVPFLARCVLQQDQNSGKLQLNAQPIDLVLPENRVKGSSPFDFKAPASIFIVQVIHHQAIGNYPERFTVICNQTAGRGFDSSTPLILQVDNEFQVIKAVYLDSPNPVQITDARMISHSQKQALRLVGISRFQNNWREITDSVTFLFDPFAMSIITKTVVPGPTELAITFKSLSEDGNWLIGMHRALESKFSPEVIVCSFEN